MPTVTATWIWWLSDEKPSNKESQTASVRKGARVSGPLHTRSSGAAHTGSLYKARKLTAAYLPLDFPGLLGRADAVACAMVHSDSSQPFSVGFLDFVSPLLTDLSWGLAGCIRLVHQVDVVSGLLQYPHHLVLRSHPII